MATENDDRSHRVAFASPGFSGTVLDEATDRRVDLDVLERQPSLPRRMFSIRWTGLLFVPEHHTYQLFLGADDRARLTIDGDVILERSPALGMSTASATVTLDAGFHAIEVDYEQEHGSSHLNLQWARTGQAAAPLDPYALFPEEPSATTLRLNLLARGVQRLALIAWTILLGMLAWAIATRYSMGKAWMQFWFPTTTAVPLAVCRIVLVSVWLGFFAKPWDEVALPLTYDPALINLSLIRGVLTLVPVEIFHTSEFFRGVWLVTTAGGVLAVGGFFTRTSLLMFGLGNCVLIAHLWSYGEWHHTEALYCLALVLLGFSPSGRCYSIDSWLGRRSRPERWGPALQLDTATWSLRLIQCLLALAYFSSGSSKLLDGGLLWMNGSTLQTIVLTDYVRFGMPAWAWLIRNYWLCVAGSVATVVIEVFFFVAIFVPASRKYILTGAAGLHIAIYLTMAAPFFTFIVLYVTFFDFERLRRLVLSRTTVHPWLMARVIHARPEGVATAVGAENEWCGPWRVGHGRPGQRALR